MKTDHIKLFYIKNGKPYVDSIDRNLFLDQMKQFAVWYSRSNNNQNALELCKIIPEIDTLKINKDIIDTQDVPFFEYTTYSNPEFNIFKLRRPCKIVWEIILYYCDNAIPLKLSKS